MILLTDAYILAQAATARPLTHPRIGYQTYTRNALANATASTTAADAAADAPLRPDTYEYWAPTALPATWTVDLGAAYDVDYVGIAGHTIGTNGASVEAFYSANNTDWYSFTDTRSFLSSTGEAWTINGTTARVAFDSSHASAYLLLDGTSGNNASTPDSVAVSIPGDFGIRVRVAPTDYTPAAANIIAGQIGTADGNRAWKFEILADGTVNLQTSPDGLVANVKNHISTVATGLTDGSVKWLYATIDVDNGAAGHDVKYYTSDDDVTLTQLGATITTAGVTSIFNSTAQVEIGGNAYDAKWFAGKIYNVKIQNGIGGPVVAKFDPLNDSSFAVAPSDDAPIMFLDTVRFARYWQIHLKGTTMPQVAVIYAGEALAMERATYGGVTPSSLARETVLKNSLSRGGRFLGQNYRRLGIKTDASFSNLTPEFVRDELDLFIRNARRFPYFFAWRPSAYPNEIAYAWTAGDINPSNMGKGRLMQANWSLRGIGYGD